MTTLNGKTVLLTGASRGIGAFIARALTQQGATVVGVARDPAKLEQVCAELREAGAECFSIPWDLSNSETLPDLVTKIEQVAGPVDILINNAGIERYRAFQDYTLSDLQAVIAINLLAAMELSRLLLPGMLARGGGHLVNMASTAAKKGHPFDSAYSASKAGLLMWSDALRQELAESPVEVSVICPGYVEQSGMLADTGVPAPPLAGATTPTAVAAAVVRAIQQNQAEVILNKDIVSAVISKVLFATWQFFPRFGDTVYRAIGVPQLNQKRIKTPTRELVSHHSP
ncbi:MAG: SDR family oxidoreductase [Cyanobacteria bacterium J06635_1]